MESIHNSSIKNYTYHTVVHNFLPFDLMGRHFDGRLDGDTRENKSNLPVHIDIQPSMMEQQPSHHMGETVEPPQEWNLQIRFKNTSKKLWKLMTGFSMFVGPGFMVAVGYLDPGNWATDLAAGSQFGYKLLFIIFLSNLMAILLQSLCIRLAVVTGLDLAQACTKHFPKKWNMCLYVLCEIAIIATDLAEVIGSAIAQNLLKPLLDRL